MNNQEATDELRYAIDLIKQDGKDWLDERDIPILEAAISALQVQEAKTQLSAEGTTFDLISRQAAIDYCYALINAENPSDPNDEWNYSQERINQTEVILHHLEFMPSAQPEIVHCRDCMYYGTYYRGNESKPVITHLCKWCLDRTMEPDDYCSHAERRTDG